MQTLTGWDFSYLPLPSSIQQWVEAHCGGVGGIFFGQIWPFVVDGISFTSGREGGMLEIFSEVPCIFWSMRSHIRISHCIEISGCISTSYTRNWGESLWTSMSLVSSAVDHHSLLQTLLLCYLVFKLTSNFIFYIWTNHIWHEKNSLITVFFSITPF